MDRLEVQLAEQAGVTIQWRDSMALFDHSNAEAFVAECDRADIRIIGIEGFTFEGKTIAPEMEWIADWSGATQAGSISDSRAFLQQAPRSLVFEFGVRSD